MGLTKESAFVLNSYALLHDENKIAAGGGGRECLETVNDCCPLRNTRDRRGASQDSSVKEGDDRETSE